MAVLYIHTWVVMEPLFDIHKKSDTNKFVMAIRAAKAAWNLEHRFLRFPVKRSQNVLHNLISEHKMIYRAEKRTL